MSPSNDYNSIKQERAKEAGIVRKVVLIVILVALIVFGIAGYFIYNYVSEGLSPVDPEDDELVEVEIPMGSNVGDIAEILEENDIINNATIFQTYVTFKNESGFQAGEYTLSRSLELDEIIESLKTGRIMLEPLFSVTIPEGSNIERIAEILDNETSIEEDEFMEYMTDEEYIESLMEEYSGLLTEDILHEDVRYPLEGYLYAITYDFHEEDPSVEEVVDKMLQQTQNRVYEYIDDMDARGMSIHEALTLASIIELEAVGEEDRLKISGVFHNRLNEEPPMALQTDPTVLYAMGEHHQRVLYEHLEYEHPYNTYQNTGLPPGPISNFHESALRASVNPEYHDYLYFVASYEGENYFAETYEEHQQNIEEHRPRDDEE
ncbi:endolytic transglycosylase MltG [Alkalibacillus haloalkaliphilus]|uniref:endolytic transglycosylase MltG n=1 Tax=Alkalibacillus haloalkaliphilus TaxID=94136 RepID=UPI002936436D|nr:endolytic transglycosylase MltG [Alkalibacillus haloalkaliphilus]MDV2581074.1 endolytic transglycosylase MltG [Alkalibacillus haloalkaliphilus]